MGSGIGSVKDPSGGAVSSDVGASRSGGSTPGASNERAFAAALEKSGHAVGADGGSPGEAAQHGQESPAGLARASGFIGPEALGVEPTSVPVRFVDSLTSYFAQTVRNHQ